MTTLYRYEIFCQTDSRVESVWATTPPTTCPVNSAHLVLLSSIAIIDKNVQNSISFGDDSIVDSYDRLKVVENKNIMNFKQVYQTNPDIKFETVALNGATGTYRPNESLTELTTSTVINSSIIFQSKDYFMYQAGSSFQIIITALIGAQKTGSIQELGYFDNNNGIFFRMDGATGLSLVNRTFASGVAVDNIILRNAWNFDKFDGTGPSTYNLDATKTQFWWIDLQWQGTGRVRVGLFINGEAVVCHKFNFTNTLTTVYMTTPCLPIRFAIRNTAVTASATTMKAICSSISIESMTDPTGFPMSIYTPVLRSVNNAAVGVANSNFIPVLSIRLKTVFKAKENRIRIQLDSFSCILSGNGATPCVYALILNPVLAGTLVWADVDTVNSGVEFNINATTATGGILINSGFINVASGFLTVNLDEFLNYSNYPLTLNVAGTLSAILTLGVKRLITGSANDAYGYLGWTEIY